MNTQALKSVTMVSALHMTSHPENMSQLEEIMHCFLSYV